jgi:AcrR family transcriptional regulator
MDKKNEIKERARELFMRFGFHKTNMDDIARAANIAKPTLYYYYKSKEDLFNEVVLEESERFLNNVMMKVPHRAPAVQKIRAFYDGIYENLEIYAEELECVDDYLIKSSPHGKPVIEKMFQMISEYLTPILKQGIEEGTFQIDNMEITIRAMIDATYFLNMFWMKMIPKEERDPIFRKVIDFIIAGLKGGSNEN